MTHLAIALGALAGALLTFWVAGVPVALVTGVARWVLGRCGVRFNPEEDDDPASLRLIAVGIGLGVGLGVFANLLALGFLLSRPLTLPALAAGSLGGAVSGYLSRNGYPGLSVTPFLMVGGVVAALVAVIVAALSGGAS